MHHFICTGLIVSTIMVCMYRRMKYWL